MKVQKNFIILTSQPHATDLYVLTHNAANKMVTNNEYK